MEASVVGGSNKLTQYAGREPVATTCKLRRAIKARMLARNTKLTKLTKSFWPYVFVM